MEALTEMMASSTLILVNIHTEWCMHCKMMDSILKDIQEIQGEALRIVKIDIDKFPQIARTYAIRSVPTLMIFNKGKQLWRQTGTIEPHELNRIIELFKH